MIKSKPKDTEKRAKILIILLLIVMFLLAALLLYLNFGRPGVLKNTLPNNDTKMHFRPDPNAEQGDLNKTNEDIISDLNKKVKKSEATISMNSSPVFANGKTKGNLLITNSTGNNYPQMVEIYTKDTDQLVYSGGVAIGSKIETSTLLVELPKGTYDCIVHFNAVDPATDKRIGTAGADIRITVLK